jgi:YggT family protein
VNDAVVAFDTALVVLRYALFALAAVAALVFALDWLVRTRRVNAFGTIARFCRSAVDPLIVPVERVVIRAGGTPASAPWWALVAVVIGGILLLSLLGAVRDLLLGLLYAISAGPTAAVRLVIAWTFQLLQIALLVRVITSWVGVSPYSRWVRWAYVLTEWILRPLRQVIPPVGMMDITPIVAYFLLWVLQVAVLRVVV